MAKSDSLSESNLSGSNLSESKVETAVVLTVAAVARRLGIAPATLRTWDRRYGIGPSGHDAGQNRLYSLEDVARLDLMRSLVIQGLTPSKAAEIAKAKNISAAQLTPVPGIDPAMVDQDLPENVISLDSPKNTIRGLLRAAQMLDSITCRQIVGNLLETKGVLWTWNNVLVPALKQLGEKWETTGEGIEVEHLLSDAIESQFRAISSSDFEPVNARPVILACTSHELHTLPIFAIAAGLAEHKISCRILGARMPADSLLAACKKVGPSAILVWSQTRGTAEPEIWDILTDQRPAPLKVAAGPGWGEQVPANVTVPRDLSDTLMAIATAAGRP